MLTALLVAGGLVAWPPHIRRLDRRAGLGVLGVETGRRRLSAAPQLVVVLVGGSVLTVTLATGLLVGLSAGLVFGTMSVLVRSESARARERRELREMLSATRSLSRELRSGAPPVTAIAACATAHRGSSAIVLETLAADVAGDRGRGVVVAGDAGLTAEIAGRLARGWSLSARYGVPWASLVDTVSVDLADRVRAEAQRSAQVSGPRVSGYVLAVMPCLGVLLGVGMGADPLHVLFGTGAGHLMLMLGCLLTCLGLGWTARIVRG